MALPPIRSVTFGLPVSDLRASTEWYAGLLGKDPESPTEGIIEFPLGDGAYLMLSEEEGSSRAASVNFQVDDIATARSAVEDLGIEPTPIEEIPSVLAYCDFPDPDGHGITLVEIKASTGA